MMDYILAQLGEMQHAIAAMRADALLLACLEAATHCDASGR